MKHAPTGSAVIGFGFLVLLAAGCADRDRSIATAKKAEDLPAAATAQIPTMTAPKESEPAAKELVAKLFVAHAPTKLAAFDAFRSFENIRSGLVAGNTPQPLFQTWTISGQWPDRYHVKAEIATLNTVAIAWSGDKAWGQVLTPAPAPAFDIPAAETASYQADATGEWLLLLFPLRDPATVVALAEPRVITGKSCPGVRVWHPKLSEAILYLDPDSNELRQVTFNGRENLQPVRKDFLVLAINETGGVRLPSRVAQNAGGLQVADWTFSRLVPKDHGPKFFEKPAEPGKP